MPAGVRKQYITFDDPAEVADPAALIKEVAAAILRASGDNDPVRMYDPIRMWRSPTPALTELECESGGVVVSLWMCPVGHRRGKWGISFAWEAPALAVPDSEEVLHQVSPKQRARDRWAAGAREGMCGTCRHRDLQHSSKSGAIFCEAHRVHFSSGGGIAIEPGRGGPPGWLEFPAWFGRNLWEAKP